MTPDEYIAEEDVYSADHSSPAWRPATWAWFLTWFLLGGLCFVQSSATSWTVPTLAKNADARRVVAKRFESRAIQDVRTGMRVVADNPELNGQEAIESEIHPGTWRNIHLRMEKPDGSELQMRLLRSLDWLEERRGEVGRDIDVNIQELGAAGPATILAIEPCPTIESGSGRVVTGTFQHSAANVIDLHVSGEDKPIGTTANHPFWSETRQQFVQAGSLQPGEELRTAIGVRPFVLHQTRRAGSISVFNLEVDAEHTYAIALSGVVVHNSQNYDPINGQGVYILKDNNTVRYVGRGNAAQRLIDHAMPGSGKEDLTGQIIFDNTLPVAQAKSLEHELIQAFGGAQSTNPSTPLKNKIQGIGEGNPNFIELEFAADDDLLIEALRRINVIER